MLISAIVILALISISSIVFGLFYLFTKEYFFYHAQLTGLAWCEIPLRYQAVVLGMLKMIGAGMLAFGVGISWLLIPLSRGELWATWAIFSIIATHGFISVYVTIILRRVNKKAKTNVFSACMGVALSIFALGLAYASQM